MNQEIDLPGGSNAHPRDEMPRANASRAGQRITYRAGTIGPSRKLLGGCFAWVRRFLVVWRILVCCGTYALVLEDKMCRKIVLAVEKTAVRGSLTEEEDGQREQGGPSRNCSSSWRNRTAS